MQNRLSEKARLDAIHAERQCVIERIWQSERTIKLSQERLKWLDELLATIRKTPPHLAWPPRYP